MATRYGLPVTEGRTAEDVARAWLRTDGASPELDETLGERRARAAVLVLLALPGSTYVYQGDELGLHEVGDLPPEALEDPMATRSPEKGRDGCRVPLPWTATGPSFGFGAGAPRMPQPDWFGRYAVSVQEDDPASTLRLYRAALRLRREMPADHELSWVEEESGAEVLHLVRPGGWHCVTNFGSAAVALPEGEVVLSSAPLEAGRLPGDTSAWVRVTSQVCNS